MDKTTQIMLSIPGNRRSVAADGVLVDLARKLCGGELSAGTHEISIFADSSIVLDNALSRGANSHQSICL